MSNSPNREALPLASFCGAAQHSPRPLPLLLEHFRTVCANDTALLTAALAGLGRYQGAARAAAGGGAFSVAAQVGAARLLRIAEDWGEAGGKDGGDGTGAPIVLIPSIINGAEILHLAPDYSLAEYLAAAGFAVYLVDWGGVDAARRDEGLVQQVVGILLPLISQIRAPAHLVGYCLGGLHAMAAAQLGGAKSLTMIASPWDFSAYDGPRRAALAELWNGQRAHCDALNCAPAELLQSAFWQLDPQQLVQKFAAAATMDTAQFNHFVRVEDWANNGRALPLNAANDIVDGLFARNETGSGKWCVGGQIIAPETLQCPALSVRSSSDRIVPFDTSPILPETLDLAEGHVGMMIGTRRKTALWEGVLSFIRRADAA